MEITQEVKSIIELIEPFMDKTLSEGLLLQGESGLIVKIKEVLNEEKMSYSLIDRHGTCNIKGLLREGGKILGHYDITAVLRLGYVDIGDMTSNYISFFIDSIEYKIPNKPLHLYTEQENKNLLELLLKIK